MTGKTQKEIERGIKVLFTLYGAKPLKIWSDKEAGLVSNQSFLQQNNIELYHTENSYDGKFSNPIVERFNRSMRDAMMKIKQEHPSQNYNQLAVNTIKNFIPFYNDKVHKTSGTSPNSVYDGDVPNTRILRENVERANEERKQPLKQWHVGDKVHVANPKEKIENKWTPKWGKVPYEIVEVKRTNPITYILKGKKGGFYSQQFQ